VPSIDNRVVSISFDNAAFQKNVQDTIKSLDDLKTKMNFGESTSGFSDLTKAAQTVNLSSISTAVDGIASKFSAMGAVAFTALQNITNRAIDAGAAFSKSFTIAPVTQGFAEYELKMGSIQTIMAGTGETLGVVNNKLQELNAYSDQTIYSFADMTQNIGKFTNAGVSLEDSVAAIKGIANVAAVSGANAEEASRSMYNFGQAMSAGTIRNIDWKSIELANMATVGFKDEIIKTAVELGTLTKTEEGFVTANGTAVTSTKNFTQSLEEEWFTADVLTKTLNRYSDATTDVGEKATRAATEVKTFSQLIGTVKEAIGSGWSASFEIFIGTFDEAKALLTEVNNAIGGFVGKSAEARNELLSKWKALGGRTILIQGLRDAFKSLGTIFKPIQEAFREVFPKKTAEDLLEITKRFAEFAKNLAISGDTAESLKSIFKGVFSIFKIGIAIVKGIFTLFSNLFGLFSSAAGGGILSFFAKIGDGITKLSSILVDGNKISGFFNSIFETIEKLTGKINIQPLIDKLKSFKDSILGIFGGGSDGSGSSVKEGGDQVVSIFDKLGQVLGKIGGFGEKVAGTIETIFTGIISFGSKVVNVIKTVWNSLTGVFSGDNFDKALKVAGVGLIGGVLVLIRRFLNEGLGGLLVGTDVMKAVTKLFGDLGNTLNAFSTNLKADALLKLAYAIGILAASIFLLSFVDPLKVGTGLAALGGSIAILIKAMQSLAAITTGPLQSKQLIALSFALAMLAGAILLLSVSMFILSKIDILSLGAGMAAIIAFLATMTQVAKKLETNSRALVNAAFSIGIMAVGMILLAVAIKLFAMMDLVTIAQGLGTVAVALAGIIASMKLLPEGTDMVNVGGGIILLAIGMLLLAAAIKTLSMMDYWDLGKGIGSIAVSLALIGLALKTMPDKDLMRLGGTLILVGIAMNLVVRAIEGIAALSVGNLVKGVVTFAAVFYLLGVALKGLEKSGLTGGLALILITFGLGKLVEVFMAMENVGWMSIIKGMFAFGAVLVTLGVAAFLMKPLAPALLALGGAVFLIGAGFALAGLSVKLFAEGLILLVQAGAKGIKFFADNIDDLLAIVPKIAKALGEAFFGLIAGFISGLPMLIQALDPILDSVITLLIKFIPRLTTLVITLIDSIITILSQKGPELLSVGYELLISFLNGLANNIGEIIIAVSNITINFLEALTEKLPDIVSAGVDFLVAFLGGITNSIGSIAPVITELIVTFIEELGKSTELIVIAGAGLIANIITGIGKASETILTAGFNALMSFLQGVSDNIQKAVDKGFEIVIELLNGVANSIRENKSKLAEAGLNLLDAIFGGIIRKALEVTAWFVALPGKIIGWIGDALGTLVTKGAEFITGLWTGIQDRIIGVTTWFKNLGTTVVGWIGDGLSWLTQIGENIVEGLWNGILAMKDWLEGKIGWFINLLPGFVKDVLGIESPSKVMRELGLNIGQGLGLGIMDSEKYTSDASKDLASSVIDNMYVSDKDLANQTIQSIKNALAMVSSDLGNMDEFNPTITPVLDLTEVQRDALSLNSIFAMSPLSASASYNQASLISTAENQRANAEASVSSTQEVNFNQVINSPTALSTNDIYRQTRSQIALAKKELSLV
jgi:tape measure domain-containing protein